MPAEDDALARSRGCFRELEGWTASEEAGLQHAELEEQTEMRGWDLLRQLFRDRLDASAAAEERRHDVAGMDCVVRGRAERAMTRPLMTKSGQVTESRIAFRRVRAIRRRANTASGCSCKCRTWSTARPAGLAPGSRAALIPAAFPGGSRTPTSPE